MVSGTADRHRRHRDRIGPLGHCVSLFVPGGVGVAARSITALDTIDDPDEDSQADDDPIDGDELEGPIDDDEPSLGATEHINQSIAWRAPDGVFFSDSEIGLGWPPNGSRPGHQGSARPGWTLTSGSVRGGILLPCGPPTC